MVVFIDALNVNYFDDFTLRSITINICNFDLFNTKSTLFWKIIFVVHLKRPFLESVANISGRKKVSGHFAGKRYFLSRQSRFTWVLYCQKNTLLFSCNYRYATPYCAISRIVIFFETTLSTFDLSPSVFAYISCFDRSFDIPSLLFFCWLSTN